MGRCRGATIVFGQSTPTVVVKHARANGNQRCGKVWRRYSEKYRHKDEREVQISCYKSIFRHLGGPRPPPEVSSRSEQGFCCGGMKKHLGEQMLHQWHPRKLVVQNLSFD